LYGVEKKFELSFPFVPSGFSSLKENKKNEEKKRKGKLRV